MQSFTFSTPVCLLLKKRESWKERKKEEEEDKNHLHLNDIQML